MKNKFLLFALLILSGINLKAQITLEHSFPNATSNFFGVIHFSNAGYKYYTTTRTAPNIAVINIYNLNYSLYKTINTPASIPNTQGMNGGIDIHDISDSLFNTNTSNIEYSISWSDSTTYENHFRIYDDVGNMLFSKDSSYCYPFFTTNGWKLNCQPAGGIGVIGHSSQVYNLPGALPCDECVNHLLSGIDPNPTGNSYFLNSFPNPTNGFVNINYQLPNGTNRGQIIFYEMQGKEVKRFIVDRTFDSLSISTSDIPAGTYFYVLQTENGSVGSKKMVVIK